MRDTMISSTASVKEAMRTTSRTVGPSMQNGSIKAVIYPAVTLMSAALTVK